MKEDRAEGVKEDSPKEASPSLRASALVCAWIGAQKVLGGSGGILGGSGGIRGDIRKSSVTKFPKSVLARFSV